MALKMRKEKEFIMRANEISERFVIGLNFFLCFRLLVIKNHRRRS